MAQMNLPSAEHADTTLAFVFDAWNLPLAASPEFPDPADIALIIAFETWRKAKGV